MAISAKLACSTLAVLCLFALSASAAPSNSTSTSGVKGRQSPPASGLPSRPSGSISVPVVPAKQQPLPVKSEVPSGVGSSGAGRPRPVRSTFNVTSVNREADKQDKSSESGEESAEALRPTNPLFHPLHFGNDAPSSSGTIGNSGVRSPPSNTNRTLPVTAAASGAKNNATAGHTFLGFAI